MIQRSIKHSLKHTSSKVLIVAIIASTSLFGCANDGSINKAGIGAIIGAVGGAVLGKQVGGRDRKTTAIGAILGGLAGAGVGGYMDKQQRELEEKLAREVAAKQIAIERLQNNVLRVNLDSGATFASGKSTLNSAFNASLSKIAQTLASNNQTVVHVIGHTDSQGANDYNMRLSEKRAVNVERFLVANGVNSSRTRTQGLGETRPVADNQNADGRRQNRRVEIYLKPVIQGQEDQAFVSPVN